MSYSIGLIELSSIAAGFQVCDAMLKESDVSLVLARTICSGKYMVMVKGDVAAVESAVQAGKSQNEFSVIDTFVIPNVDESLFPAIAGTLKTGTMEAIGIIESFSVASLIEGADQMVKSANVRLMAAENGVLPMTWIRKSETPDKPPPPPPSD